MNKGSKTDWDTIARMGYKDIEKIVKAVESDMGHECPDLAVSLEEMKTEKAKIKNTNA